MATLYNIFAEENKSLTVVGDKEYESSILFRASSLGIPAFCFEDIPLGMFDICLGIEEFKNKLVGGDDSVGE